MKLKSGQFIRVRSDHGSTRAGKDSVVYRDCGESVALLFGFDRFNKPQNVECVGVELWDKDELNLESATDV